MGRRIEKLELSPIDDLWSADEYKDDQYIADNAPKPYIYKYSVNISIHSNIDILFQPLCKSNILGQCQVKENRKCILGFHPINIHNLQNDDNNDKKQKVTAPLCKEYIMNNYCNSNRPRGSWCYNGYHWTLNDEIHFRNYGELPLIDMISVGINDNNKTYNKWSKHSKNEAIYNIINNLSKYIIGCYSDNPLNSIINIRKLLCFETNGVIQQIIECGVIKKIIKILKINIDEKDLLCSGYIRQLKLNDDIIIPMDIINIINKICIISLCKMAIC